MIIRDLVGNSLEVGDLVVIKTDIVVGQIVKIETGEIARGVSLSGDKPHGELAMPMVIVGVQMSSAAVPGPDGRILTLVKANKPAQDKSVVEE